MTMAMFAGMAVLAPFVIMPLVRWLAVPIRRLFPTGGLSSPNTELASPAGIESSCQYFVVRIDRGAFGRSRDEVFESCPYEFRVHGGSFKENFFDGSIATADE